MSQSFKVMISLILVMVAVSGCRKLLEINRSYLPQEERYASAVQVND